MAGAGKQSSWLLFFFILTEKSKNWSKQERPRAGLLALFLATRQASQAPTDRQTDKAEPAGHTHLQPHPVHAVSLQSTQLSSPSIICVQSSPDAPSAPECQEQQGLKCLCWRAMTFHLTVQGMSVFFLVSTGSSNSCTFGAVMAK